MNMSMHGYGVKCKVKRLGGGEIRIVIYDDAEHLGTSVVLSESVAAVVRDRLNQLLPEEPCDAALADSEPA